MHVSLSLFICQKLSLQVCREHHYVDEQIHVLSRMGPAGIREALALIVDSLLDIHRAVAFCKEHDDPDLWADLIDRSLDKPYFVNVLLHNIGTHVDPRILVGKIEKGQEIPGLRDSLVRIMHDYRVQVSLHQGCRRILAADCHDLLRRQIRTQTKGLKVTADAMCPGCGGPVIRPAANCAGAGAANDRDLVAFRCRHVFHADCLGSDGGEVDSGDGCGGYVCTLCYKCGAVETVRTRYGGVEST